MGTDTKKNYILFFLLFVCAFVAYSQEDGTRVRKYLRVGDEYVGSDTVGTHIRMNKRHIDVALFFRFDKHYLDINYMNNEKQLRNFKHKIDSIGFSNIDSIVIVSQSSPEGAFRHNINLSRNRAKTMRKYVLDNYPELSDRLYVHPDGESWLQLREYVKKDTLMKKSTIEKVLSVIDADVTIETKKWRMEQLPVYRYLLKTYYPRIRNSVFCIIYYSETDILPEPVLDEYEYVVAAPDSIPFIAVSESDWTRRLHIKSNAIGLGLSMANIAAEIDIAKHWSFTLPVYYTALDYFTSTVKFRTFAIQPELRYWLNEDNDGFFAGAHFGLAYYNFAFDGKYRYQDHNGHTPALGGGVALGYRIPIGDNGRWRLEFSLGAGAYPLHYDKFHNADNTKDGLLIESVKKTYCGIDQAAVSLTYSLDFKKKGGK